MNQSLTGWMACAVLCGILVCACAGTRLTETWADAARRGNPVSNILVIAVADKEDVSESFEREFVRQFKTAGVNAISSAAETDMPADLELEKEVILDAVDRYGSDAVIITHLIGLDERETFNRTGVITGGYYSYYGYVYDYVHVTGFWSGIETVRLETSLFDVETENRLWSGRSQSGDLKSVRRLIDDVVSLVVTDLQKSKLLPPPKGQQTAGGGS